MQVMRYHYTTSHILIEIVPSEIEENIVGTVCKDDFSRPNDTSVWIAGWLSKRWCHLASKADDYRVFVFEVS